MEEGEQGQTGREEWNEEKNKEQKNGNYVENKEEWNEKNNVSKS